jgi:hypothetical protein
MEERMKKPDRSKLARQRRRTHRARTVGSVALLEERRLLLARIDALNTLAVGADAYRRRIYPINRVGSWAAGMAAAVGLSSLSSLLAASPKFREETDAELRERILRGGPKW